MPTGMTVLALHSAALDPSSWNEVQELVPEVEFVTPHLGRLAEEVHGSFPAVVERLVGLLPEGPVVVAGCSVGARIGLEVAARLGKRTRGLVLLSGGPVEEDEGFLQMLQGWRALMVEGFDVAQIPSLCAVMLYRFGPRFPEASAKMKMLFEREAGQNAAALGQLFLRFPNRPAELLTRFDAPIEVFFGRYDPWVQSHWPREWSRIQRARVTILQNAAHQIPLEAPEEVAAALRRLIARPD